MIVFRKITKFIVIAFLIILLLAGSLYWYFVHNAESLLRDYVDFESKGTIALKIRTLSFDPEELRLTLIGPRLYSKDSTNKNTTFAVSIDTVVMELASLKPILFGEMIRVDSIILKKPSVTIVKRKIVESKNDFSLPQQMGKAYSNLDTLLQKLSIQYCLVDSGAFKLLDQTRPNSTPLVISDYYLLIDNLQRSPDTDLPNRFLFSDRIKFYSSHQKIKSIDGNHELRFSRLRVNSYRKIIELDSCFVSGQKQQDGFNRFSGFFDTLRFTNVDFARFAEDNILDADSVYCINPAVTVQTSLHPGYRNNKKWIAPISKDSLSAAVKFMLGNFEIRNLDVVNAGIDLQTRKEGKLSTYQIRRIDFSMKNVMVIDKPEFPVKVGSFDLGLMGYKATDPDSNYTVRFDSIRFINDKIQLSYLSVLSNPHKKQTNSIKDIRMRSLFIKNISWVDLMTSKRIVADEIELQVPLIHAVMPENHRVKKTGAGQFFNVVQLAASIADVKNLKITDAELDYQKSDSIGYRFRGLNLTIDVNRFLHSHNYSEMASSISDISFKQGEWNDEKKHLMLNNGRVTPGFQNVFVENLDWDVVNNPAKISLRGLEISGIRRIEEENLDAGVVSWQEGIVKMKLQKRKEILSNAAKIFQINTNAVYGKNTAFTFTSDSFSFHSIVDEIDAGYLKWNIASRPEFESLNLKGDFMDLTTDAMKFHSGAYGLADKHQSFVKDIIISKIKVNPAVEAEIKSVQFIPDIRSLLNKSIQLSKLDVFNPVFKFSDIKQGNDMIAGNKKSLAFPEMEIKNITVHHPVINGMKLKNGMVINTGRESGDLKIGGIYANSSILNIEKLKISLQALQAENEKYRIRIPEGQFLKSEISQIKLIFDQDVSSSHLMANVDDLLLDKAEISIFDSIKGLSEWKIRNANFRHLKYNDLNKPNVMGMLLDDDSFELKQLDASCRTKQSRLVINGFSFSGARKQMAFDSIGYSPAEEVTQFMKSNQWQKDYMSFSAGRSVVDGLEKQAFVNDNSILARRAIVNDASLYIFKDKRLPFKKGVPKLSPAGLINAIGLPVSLDTVSINNARVTYEEFNDKTQKSGSVKFTDLKAQLFDVNNVRLNKTDSLKLIASGNFMDSAHLRFRFTQAYADSINSFSLALRFSPFNLKALNPILDPLATAVVNTGTLDTLRLNAIGNDSLGVGKMKMYYSGLKIKFLGTGGDSSRTLKSRLITFLANDILIKRNNQKGYGMVYANRDRERSFANYWMKILVSGVISSSGIKSNRKVEKKYHKGIIKMNIPELPEVHL